MSVLKEKTVPRRDRKLCPVVDCGEGLTEQTHKNQCDINVILADYARTGFIRHAKDNQGRYDDVSQIDFQQAMITVANVKNMFEGLPSEVRKEFGHDAGQFLGYVQDPKNAEALEQRGISIGNDGVDINGAYLYTKAVKAAAALKAGETGESSSVSELSSVSQQASESATE